MFELFTSFFYTVLQQPLFNGLVLLYKYIPGHDFGIAVIVLTILIRLVIYPLSAKGIKAQKELSGLQPKMKEIQDKFKNDKEKQAKAMMELYQREKVNPLSGCLPLLIQLPIIIALYRVFWTFDSNGLQGLYSFVHFSNHINTSFLGMVELTEAFWPFAILVGVLQFFQTKMIIPKPGKIKHGSKDTMAQFSNMMQKQMLYFFPVFIVLILWALPSVLALYLIVFTLFSIVQQYFTLKKTETGSLDN
ncbi:membrane protein insertase YidC [Candidatus Parcubacteria bacterium]|nr:membrane protein insertase YidC [Candidatus Parcubacteria bacterium]